MSDQKPKKEAAEARKARKQQRMRELRAKRERQLSEARKVAEVIDLRLRAALSAIAQCDALSDHARGFYEEVDKLAKGRHLIEATHRVTERTNEIIRDAKKIVRSDVYLDRIKEFVAAGNNPVYPDVVVSVRSVLDSLRRGREPLKANEKASRRDKQKVETVISALEYVLDEQIAEADRRYPSKSTIEEYKGGLVADSCFSRYEDSDEKYFDFDHLDSQPLEEYLSVSEDRESGQADSNPGLGGLGLKPDEIAFPGISLTQDNPKEADET